MRLLVFCLIVTVPFAALSTGCHNQTADAGTSRTSAFVGRWDGPFVTASQKGLLHFDVAQDGKLTGSIDNQTLNAKGTLSGSIANGTMSGSFVQSGNTYEFHGQVEVKSNGHFTGVLHSFRGDKEVSNASIDLTR